MDAVPSYLLHRHSVACDKVYWENFKSETKHCILWLDYSQNIKLTPKNDVESASYSGKQHTLHDALIQFPNGDRKYIFHHDCVITTQILKGIIIHYPELLENGTLVLRSDNSSTQYKSRFVFYNMIQFSKELNVPIYWFYGEPGHGRGLIDAMGWFGRKGPLRKAIIQADKWFPTALCMTEFLTTIFTDDSTKFYHYVNDENTAILRKNNECKDHPLPGCMAAHLITFKPDGSA